MGKAKHQKPKPNKQPKQSQSKKGGDQADTSKLRGQLDALGLKIIQVTADGNCFFSAICVAGHWVINWKAMRMSTRSTAAWSFNLLRIIVKCLSPLLKMKFHLMNTVGPLGRMALGQEIWNCKQLLLSLTQTYAFTDSYHDGEHYNSVRSKDDPCSGPARPIVIKGDADLSAKSNQPKVAAMKYKRDSRGKVVHEESIELVKSGSGCKDARKVEQALQEMGGDVDAAIEVLIAEQEHIDQKVSHDDFFHSAKSSNDGNQDENSDPQKLKVEENACKQDVTGKLKEKIHKNIPQPDEKKISRNKSCPCGSKKKYKSCCGSVAGTSYGKFPNNQTVDCGKSRKDRKQGRKGGSTVANFIQSDEGLPDMGALCI